MKNYATKFIYAVQSIVCLALLFISTSCSDEPDYEPTPEPDDPLVIMTEGVDKNDEMMLQTMIDFDGNDINSVIQNLRNRDDVASVDYSDNIITLIMNDGSEVMAAPFHEFPESPGEFDGSDFIGDEDGFDYIEDLFNLQNVTEGNNYASHQPVRVTQLASADIAAIDQSNYAKELRKLMKKRVAIFNPWKNYPKDRGYSTDFALGEYYVRRACADVGFACDSLTDAPQAFYEFPKYDIVVVSGHGLEKGQLILPWSLHTVYQSPFVDEYGNIDKMKMNAAGVRVVILGHGKNSSYALVLEKPFFDMFFKGGKLHNTVVWGCFCYSAVDGSHFARGVYETGDCAEMYGTPHVSDYMLDYNVGRTIRVLAHGRSTYFGLTEEEKGYITIKNKLHTYDIIRWGLKHNSLQTIHGAYFPLNTATKPQIATAPDGKHAYSLSGRIVALFDNLLKTAKYGVKARSGEDMDGLYILLTNHSDNSTRSIPVLPETVDNYNVRQVTKTLSVADFSIKVDDLQPSTTYSYQTYFKQGDDILALGHSETFTTEEEDISDFEMYQADMSLTYNATEILWVTQRWHPNHGWNDVTPFVLKELAQSDEELHIDGFRLYRKVNGNRSYVELADRSPRHYFNLSGSGRSRLFIEIGQKYTRRFEKALLFESSPIICELEIDSKEVGKVITVEIKISERYPVSSIYSTPYPNMKIRSTISKICVDMNNNLLTVGNQIYIKTYEYKYMDYDYPYNSLETLNGVNSVGYREFNHNCIGTMSICKSDYGISATQLQEIMEFYRSEEPHSIFTMESN